MTKSIRFLALTLSALIPSFAQAETHKLTQSASFEYRYQSSSISVDEKSISISAEDRYRWNSVIVDGVLLEVYDVRINVIVPNALNADNKVSLLGSKKPLKATLTGTQSQDPNGDPFWNGGPVSIEIELDSLDIEFGESRVGLVKDHANPTQAIEALFQGVELLVLQKGNPSPIKLGDFGCEDPELNLELPASSANTAE